jgi:cytidylate kinase
VQVIAIDGPSGSGKSTVSRLLAERLGVARLDTGAMYRAVALLALRLQIDLEDGDLLAGLAEKMNLQVDERVVLDGTDVSNEIRTQEIDRTVPFVARQVRVREELVRRQRSWAATHGGGVVEGRDIGSVVFPDAALKVYLTASEAERARRRSAERPADVTAKTVQMKTTAEAIAERDGIDSSREASPLLVADGAVVLDSTGLSVDEVVSKIVAML